MKTAFFTGVALFVSVSACALDVPEPTGRYVSDFAAMLPESSRAELEESLSVFDRESSNQILVVTFPSLQGDSPEDFSIRLAEKWKPGTEKKDNGAILLIFRDDREVRIEVGYGLEGTLPDATAKMIIENEIVPRFRDGDFNGGIRAAATAMINATRGEYKTEPAEDKFDQLAPFFYLLMMLYFLLPWVAYAAILIAGISIFGLPFGLVGALFLIGILHVLRKAFFSGSTFTRGGHGGGLSFGGFGGGGFSSGGGGFSGGGGSFGGGGAGGRW